MCQKTHLPEYSNSNLESLLWFLPVKWRNSGPQPTISVFTGKTMHWPVSIYSRPSWWAEDNAGQQGSPDLGPTHCLLPCLCTWCIDLELLSRLTEQFSRMWRREAGFRSWNSSQSSFPSAISWLRLYERRRGGRERISYRGDTVEAEKLLFCQTGPPAPVLMHSSINPHSLPLNLMEKIQMCLITILLTLSSSINPKSKLQSLFFASLLLWICWAFHAYLITKSLPFLHIMMVMMMRKKNRMRMISVILEI